MSVLHLEGRSADAGGVAEVQVVLAQVRARTLRSGTVSPGPRTSSPTKTIVGDQNLLTYEQQQVT